MEEVQQNDAVKLSRYFSYHGKGNDLFKVYIVNVLLTLLTVGLYYPWAKAKILRYHYAETEFKDTRFAFHGTGKEMFKGFIKVVLLLVALFGIFQFATMKMQEAIMSGESTAPYVALILGIELCFFLLIPLAIVGSAKYRASRSSWRGIHFRYTGTVKSMYMVFLKGIFFTIVTFGIYGIWFVVDIVEEVVDNMALGNVKFRFEGNGKDLLFTNLFGQFLTMITAGIYFFRFKSDIHQYWVNNIYFFQGRTKGKLEAETTGMGFFKVLVPNMFIIVFSLGLAIPWAIIRQLKYFAETTKVRGKVDFDNIEQGEVDQSDATGDGLFDMLDLDIS